MADQELTAGLTASCTVEADQSALHQTHVVFPKQQAKALQQVCSSATLEIEGLLETMLDVVSRPSESTELVVRGLAIRAKALNDIVSLVVADPTHADLRGAEAAVYGKRDAAYRDPAPGGGSS